MLVETSGRLSTSERKKERKKERRKKEKRKERREEERRRKKERKIDRKKERKRENLPFLQANSDELIYYDFCFKKMLCTSPNKAY